MAGEGGAGSRMIEEEEEGKEEEMRKVDLQKEEVFTIASKVLGISCKDF